MHSSCNTKWWIVMAWIRRHETTSKRKLAYEWPTAHMSKILIHNNVSFLFLYFVAWEFFFPLHSIYLRNFWKESKNRLFLQFLMDFYFVATLVPRRIAPLTFEVSADTIYTKSPLYQNYNSDIKIFSSFLYIGIS